MRLAWERDSEGKNKIGQMKESLSLPLTKQVLN